MTDFSSDPQPCCDDAAHLSDTLSRAGEATARLYALRSELRAADAVLAAWPQIKPFLREEACSLAQQSGEEKDAGARGLVRGRLEVAASLRALAEETQAQEAPSARDRALQHEFLAWREGTLVRETEAELARAAAAIRAGDLPELWLGFFSFAEKFLAEEVRRPGAENTVGGLLPALRKLIAAPLPAER